MWNAGGDGQTVLNFAGTGTTKFSGDCFQWNAGGDVQTVFNLVGTGTTKFSAGLFETIYFFGRGVNSGHKFHFL